MTLSLTSVDLSQYGDVWGPGRVGRSSCNRSGAVAELRRLQTDEMPTKNVSREVRFGIDELSYFLSASLIVTET